MPITKTSPFDSPSRLAVSCGDVSVKAPIFSAATSAPSTAAGHAWSMRIVEVSGRR